MAVELTPELLNDVQHELEGTCRGLSEIIEAHGLHVSEDELQDRLLDGNNPVERSVCCEWWFAVSELEFDEHQGGGVCRACEPEMHET